MIQRATRLALTGLLLAAAPITAALPQSGSRDWNQTFADTGKGHRMGNPAAPVQLIEFVSYTCPHCANFERQAEGALRLGYVGEGKVAVEVRHVIRNPVDLAAALVTECGPTDSFFANHRTMMLAHDQWMAKARAATPAQQARWGSGPVGQRMQAIANDLDFHELMAPRGLSVTQINTCLTNEARAEAIAEASRANSDEFGVQGTPSFVINNRLAPDVHSWDSLRPLLDRAQS
jgi:protein-disulfide isomerase